MDERNETVKNRRICKKQKIVFQQHLQNLSRFETHEGIRHYFPQRKDYNRGGIEPPTQDLKTCVHQAVFINFQNKTKQMIYPCRTFVKL